MNVSIISTVTVFACEANFRGNPKSHAIQIEIAWSRCCNISNICELNAFAFDLSRCQWNCLFFSRRFLCFFFFAHTFFTCRSICPCTFFHSFITILIRRAICNSWKYTFYCIATAVDIALHILANTSTQIHTYKSQIAPSIHTTITKTAN